MNKKSKKNTTMTKIVKVDITDLLELARQIVMEGNGGIGMSDIEYIGDIEHIAFRIPDHEEEGKCNRLLSSNEEEGGCGETGGSCICGELEDHDGDCICKLCGHEY